MYTAFTYPLDSKSGLYRWISSQVWRKRLISAGLTKPTIVFKYLWPQARRLTFELAAKSVVKASASRPIGESFFLWMTKDGPKEMCEVYIVFFLPPHLNSPNGSRYKIWPHKSETILCNFSPIDYIVLASFFSFSDKGFFYKKNSVDPL